MILKVENLSIQLRNNTIVKDISFSVERGEAVALLGPIGSGKTTLIRSILRFVKPSSGTITVDGKAFYIPANTSIYPTTTGIHLCHLSSCNPTHLQLLSRQWHIPTDKVLTHLSEGERKSLFWAVAMSTGATLILADEPWQGIDVERRMYIKQHITQWLTDNKSLLIASHELWEIEKTVDKVIFIKNGSIIKQGYLDELKADMHMTLEEMYTEICGVIKHEAV